MAEPRALHDLTRDELAVLVPELLLCGHLIDRSGMPHAIGAFGIDGMRDIAIEEWMGASPVYTKRMQRALGFEGSTVEVIFKGMQLDVGAPPQFMDFRYTVHDNNRGEFHLDHCGALMDVEPMGEDYVVAMCHDIEDPTFDATAIATNVRAQVRPLHRPPRTPSDRQPHCAWTVTIDDAHDALPIPAIAEQIGRTAAAGLDLTAIDPNEDGLANYGGPLLNDLDFGSWARSALVRTAEEICVQQHLLFLSYREAVRQRARDHHQALDIARRQLTGIAGLTAERLRLALDLPADLDGAAQVLKLHPMLLPATYVDATVELDDRLMIRLGKDDASTADGAWSSLVDADHVAPFDALLRAIDPRFRADVVGDDDHALTIEVVTDDEPHPECGEVALTRFSTGADFAFVDRGTPVEIGIRP